MPTIRDVAERAGVSVGTASRVLAGHPSTSESSRAAVHAAAADLGYRVDGRARALRLMRSHTLGLLVSDVRNPFFSELAHAADQAASEAGYLCLLANANEDAAQERRYFEAFGAQKVDGVLATPQSADNSELDRLLEEGVPVVFVDRVVAGVEVPSVTVDNAGGIRQALEHLRRRGHRRVGYIAGPAGVSTSVARFEAYSRFAAEMGFDTDSSLVTGGDFRVESGILAAQSLLDLAEPPTAILAADGLMAVGAYTVISARWSGSPLVELVSFDDLDVFTNLHLPISAVNNDPGAMGAKGVEMLLRALDGDAVESIVLPTRFIDRAPRGKQ